MPPKHGINYAKLGRETAHRMALFRNQVTSLLKHERIQTTIAKAMALRRIADSMITLGKEGTEASYRRAEGFIREPRVAEKVFKELAVRYKFRPGGYTRVVRSHHRKGDNATMAYIELVDRPGELRPARAVDYVYAVTNNHIPAPATPLPTDATELAALAAAAPSTSTRLDRLDAPRPSFNRRNNRYRDITKTPKVVAATPAAGAEGAVTAEAQK